MAALSKRDLRRIRYLYYKNGYSAKEIAEEFKVSIDCIYYFMRHYSLPRRTFFESNRVRFERKESSFFLKRRLTEREKQLKIAGIMLYWAEGANSNPKYGNYTVDLANSNPQMIKIFLKFLRVICGINEKRLRVYLYSYADQDIEALKKYWHKVTNISLKQFTKPYIRKDYLQEKSGKMKYGLVHIRYSDKKLFLQIQDWIKQYTDKNR